MDEDRIQSNYRPSISTPSHPNYEPVVLPFDENEDFLSESYSADDNGVGSMDYSVSIPIRAQPQEPPPQPKDWKAISEAKLYEKISANGVAREMDVQVSMIDDIVGEGSGKAAIIMGKDAKKRAFEIPITIKYGVVAMDNAIDLDTNSVIDIKNDTKSLFEAPSKSIMDGRMMKVYEKYNDFFKGKPNEKKVKAMMLRYPSLSENDAQLFLDEQYYTARSKSKIYSAVDRVKANKKAVFFIGMGLAGAIVIAALAKGKEDSSQVSVF